MKCGTVSSLQLGVTRRWDAGYNLDVLAELGGEPATVASVQGAMATLQQRGDAVLSEAGRLRREAAALTKRARALEASAHRRGSR